MRSGGVGRLTSDEENGSAIIGLMPALPCLAWVPQVHHAQDGRVQNDVLVMTTTS